MRLATAVLSALTAVGAGSLWAAESTWGYDPEYEETAELIDLVRGAAELVASAGAEAACERFREPDSEWLHGETYVFVLDLEGTTLCHPARPSLEGRATLDLRDPHGRPIVQSFLRELEGEAEDGWVHYLWPTPKEKFTFYWKTSYIRRATDPGGRDYIVGSGLYQMRMERFFVVEQVEDAVELIDREGDAAFDTLRDRAGGFRFYDAYIFVLDETGNMVVNVAFPEREGQNAIDLEDSEGKLFVREMLDQLRQRPGAWVDYMWPRPGDTRPSRKSSYVRRLELEDRTLVVGAGVYLP